MIFNNKTALVTGGTSGIGKEIVKQLLIEGTFAYINYGHDEKLKEETEQELTEYKAKIKFIKADLSKEEEIVNMFGSISKLDYLVNNAGTNIDELIENIDINNFKKVIDTNLIGKVICTKYAIPLLKNSTSPSIVNISSYLGVRPCEESSAYCSAAAGIINFTEVSAIELSKYKIRVNTVCPGFTPTPLSLDSWSREEIEQKEKTNPLGRLAEPVDTANAVLFLLSDKASYVNGVNIPVNGGSKLK